MKANESTDTSSHLTRSILLWIGTILLGGVGETLIEYGTNLLTRRMGSLAISIAFYTVGVRMAIWLEQRN